LITVFTHPECEYSKMLIDDLEESGIVGPAKSGAKQRDVLQNPSLIAQDNTNQIEETNN